MLNVLGPLQITLAGAPVAMFQSDKARALLLYLVVESNRPHRREELTGLLWPDVPEQTARHNLRQTLFNVRQAIHDQKANPPYLLVTREEIQFNAESDHALDVATFAALLAACEAHPHPDPETCVECAARRQQAVELYRGRFLQQFFLEDSAAFEEWALLRREALHERALEALARLARHYEQRADYEAARRCAQRELELDPWREEAHRQVMRALAAGGQRSAALVQYETCRRVLADELGIEPSAETRTLFERIRSGDLKLDIGKSEMSPMSNVHPPTSNLPAASTPFVGRERELQDLGQLLADPQCRLLTLVGPGGMGKTRLALELASQHRHAFRDGANFVSLAPLTTPALIVHAMAEGLGITFVGPSNPQQQLFHYLAEKQILLIVDNVEHLLEWAGLFAEILQHAPAVKILATSREPLDLMGEWVFQVEGLTVPQNERGEGIEAYSAVALFLQRARRARAGFAVQGDEWTAVARICELVGGMPLGLELAATWVRVLSCREIAEQIERNLDFLTAALRDLPARHRSLRAVFDQSWSMLTEEERGVMRRLSVFRGGFDRKTAERLAGASLALLASLVGKSLVRRTEDDRYDLHDIVRQYARGRLIESGEFDRVGREHAEFFLCFAQDAEPKLYGPAQVAWLDRLEKDHSNLGAALEWLLSRDDTLEDGSAGARSQNAQDALRLAGALYLFWKRHHHWSEGREWLARALATTPALPTRARAKTLLGAVLLAVEQADTRAARELSEEHLALALELKDPQSLAGAQDAHGYLLWKQKDFAAARGYCEQALDLFRPMGERFGMAEALHHLGHIAINQDDWHAAQDFLSEAATIYRELRDATGLGSVLGDLGLVAYLQKDFATARAYLEESLAKCRAAGNLPGMESALNRLGDLARCEGDYAAAERLYSDCLASYRGMGDQDEIPSLLHNLGWVAQHRGDYAQALTLFREGLAIQRENDNRGGIAECLAGVAGVWGAQGKMVQGARLFATAEAQRRAAGASVWPANQVEYERLVTRLRQALDAAALTSAWTEGQGMTMERA
ncbi:MAG: tetratricopeptide repeat protein, partial [Acidobacteriota bacterium]